MKMKVVSLLLCLFMITTFMVGCGAKNDDSANAEIATDEQKTTTDQAKTDDKSSDNTAKEKKKIVIVKETSDQTRLDTAVALQKELEKEGYVSGKNLEITDIVIESNDKSGVDAVEKIKGIKPDLVVVIPLVYAAQTVAKPLDDLGIPTLVTVYVEQFVDADGVPKGNVSGIYSMPKDLQANAFKLLDKISPAKGKKAVFITQDGLFTKEDVEKSLQTAGVQLKDYVVYKYDEEFQAAIKKYNEDSEVCWTLVGIWSMLKKDGTSLPIEATPRADYFKKPTVTYWENGSSWGLLCGLGVDLPTTGTQAGEMAVKIFNGESIKNIKATQPRKTNILLNQKRAQALGIEFPADVLSSAYRVFTDYEAHYQGQK